MQLATAGTGNIESREPISMAHRLTLGKGEVRRLPGAFRQIAVISGCVWVSLAGEDKVLEAGESLPLNGARDFAVVEAMCRAATFEVSRR